VRSRATIVALTLWTVVAGALLTGAGPTAQTTTALRRHALLIGISSYARKPLQGPAYDVSSLATMLRTRYRFDTVRLLEDSQATRDGILAAFDDLAATTRPGDTVFIYYSGHGTSAMDRGLRLPGLGSYTGALLPSGFTPGRTPEVLQRVIIGDRDLKKRIAAFERDRDVFVVFDTCFSGNTVRSFTVDGGSVSRSMPWSDLVTSRAIDFGDANAPGDFGRETAVDAGYPYRNTVYLAAAGSGEEAQDITRERLPKHPTIDGQPHGALTDALLRALSGEANTNGDDVLTYRELFGFVRAEVTRSFPHTPQLSAPDGRDNLLDRPVFGAKGVGRPAAPAGGRQTFRVLVRPGDLDASLRTALAGIPSVTMIGDGPHDLRVQTSASGNIVVLHGSGDRLGEYTGNSARVQRDVVERVTRQARAQQLLTLRFPAQDFNVAVDIAAPRGYLILGERAVIRLVSDLPAHLLIVNIDVGGHISVVYPAETAELGLVTQRQLPPVVVSQPTGTEFLKVFAFQQRPAGLDRWMNREFEADSSTLDELLTLVRTAPGRRAETSLKLVTSERAR
jgi:caspase domain-containing protein